MSEKERTAKYRAWVEITRKFPNDYRIEHDITDDSFTPVFQGRDPVTKFWLTLEKMDSWRFEQGEY